MSPFLLLLLTAAAGDITVTVTPEPLAVQRAVLGQVRGVGTWTMRACSEADGPMTIDAVRIAQAAAQAGLGPIARSRGLAVLDRARYEKPASRLARVLDYGLMGATAFGAVQGIDTSALKYMALTIPIARQAADRLRSRTPAFDSAELLDGEVALGPGACVERTMFSGLVKGAKTLTFTLKGRRPLPPAPPISSIPPALGGIGQ
jgi:hypothetical protein